MEQLAGRRGGNPKGGGSSPTHANKGVRLQNLAPIFMPHKIDKHLIISK